MNSSRVGVQQHGAVRARRLGNRIALHVRRPRAAVRVVLERVEVARLGAELERDLRHLARRTGMVRRQLAALLRLLEAAAARREDDRAGVDRRARRRRARQPCSRRSSERSGLFGERRRRARLERLAQRLRDRVAGAVADLEQALARRAAAAREAVAAVLARELDAELLEPVDRRRRLRREHRRRGCRSAVSWLDFQTSSACCSGESSLAERRLDPALRLRGVARLERSLGRERDARAGPLGGDGGRETGGAAADHEHVEGRGRGHDQRSYLIQLISISYS